MARPGSLLVMAKSLAIALVAVALLGSCGSDNTGRASQSSTGSTSINGDITVFAAASLTAAYTDIGDAFMEAHPETDVTFNFGSSSDLVAQLVQGAPADAYASADEANMTRLVDADGA